MKIRGISLAALAVCRAAEIDLAEVERWSVSEGMRKPFRHFRKELEARHRIATIRRS